MTKKIIYKIIKKDYVGKNLVIPWEGLQAGVITAGTAFGTSYGVAKWFVNKKLATLKIKKEVEQKKREDEILKNLEYKRIYRQQLILEKMR